MKIKLLIYTWLFSNLILKYSCYSIIAKDLKYEINGEKNEAKVEEKITYEFNENDIQMGEQGVITRYIQIRKILSTVNAVDSIEFEGPHPELDVYDHKITLLNETQSELVVNLRVNTLFAKLNATLGYYYSTKGLVEYGNAGVFYTNIENSADNADNTSNITLYTGFSVYLSNFNPAFSYDKIKFRKLNSSSVNELVDMRSSSSIPRSLMKRNLKVDNNSHEKVFLLSFKTKYTGNTNIHSRHTYRLEFAQEKVIEEKSKNTSLKLTKETSFTNLIASIVLVLYILCTCFLCSECLPCTRKVN